MRLIVAASIEAQPWKNGGGVVRELLRQPDDDRWLLRIAVADIDADGPFSEFVGVERWFTVLGSGGVELTVNEGGRTMSHCLPTGGLPFQFDGGSPTSCRLLDGRAQALNLMLRGAHGRVEPVIDGEDWIAGSACCGIYSTVAGRCNGFDMPAGSLMWFDVAPECLSFTAESPSAAASGWWLAATPGQRQ